jgi:flagellar assembly protein FliH
VARILNVEGDGEHLIDRYSFKSLLLGDENDNTFKEISFIKSEVKEDKVVENETSSVPVAPKSSSDELVETLLKKSDELSSSLIKMEMQLEKQSGEFDERMREASKRAYEDGYNKAREETIHQFESQVNSKIELISNSIAKIETVYESFENKISSIEKELVSVAIDIANEVINSEVSQNSAKIASSFAHQLLDEVKEASQITIKVNPNDIGYLQEQIKNDDKIKFISDSAVSEGGVVILSDVGNIDAQIHQRFKNLKNSILSQREGEE